MKSVFSKIAKIGEEVRQAQHVEFAVGDKALEAKINAELDKPITVAMNGYDMVMKAKQNFARSISQYQTLIAKFEKEMNAYPTNSPGYVAYKNGLVKAKDAKKSVENFAKLADRFPTF